MSVLLAKLSEQFYQKFGHELVGELVTWLNQVETASRDQLRESIEQNFARFDAKLEQRIAELRAEFRGALADQRAELIKWMFVFWVGNVATLGGLMFALFNHFRP